MASRHPPAPTDMPENWIKAGLPRTISDTKTSLKLVKRLVAIGLSQIAYLRTNLPEDSFKALSIGDVELQVLKGKTSNKFCATICGMLKNSMAALDKGYLRTMDLIFFENEDNPEEIMESYCFNFSRSKTSNGDMTTTGLSILKNGATIFEPDAGKQGRPGDEYIYKNTKRLLRRLIVHTQNLPELPDAAFMNMRLGYYDDITPEGYEPPGFVPTSKDVHFGDIEPSSCHIGQIQSGFHTVGLKLSTRTTIEDLDLSRSTRMNESSMEVSVEDKENLNASIVPLTPGLDVTAGSRLSLQVKDAVVIEQMESMNIEEEERVNMKNANRGAELNSSRVSNKPGIRRKRSRSDTDSFGKDMVKHYEKVSKAMKAIRV